MRTGVHNGGSRAAGSERKNKFEKNGYYPRSTKCFGNPIEIIYYAIYRAHFETKMSTENGFIAMKFD